MPRRRGFTLIELLVVDMTVYSMPRSGDGTLQRKPPTRFPAIYSDPLKTPLRKEVQPGRQAIPLDLP